MTANETHIKLRPNDVDASIDHHTTFRQEQNPYWIYIESLEQPLIVQNEKAFKPINQ